MDNFRYSYPERVYFGRKSAMDAIDKENAALGDTVTLVYGQGDHREWNA